ncbi:hypothetical protein QFZ30_001493 [Arthrobacter pascens]|uniref:hypothetical protein n=1 Tax=Arthrobacter pascens TaxID=1677 RepID=UPI002792D0F6|nr:hypothetical protein [Arthrobacter pascens]MDQ0678111.1 hypothetical protein [Arthrobacter pascens]
MIQRVDTYTQGSWLRTTGSATAQAWGPWRKLVTDSIAAGGPPFRRTLLIEAFRHRRVV